MVIVLPMQEQPQTPPAKPKRVPRPKRLSPEQEQYQKLVNAVLPLAAAAYKKVWPADKMAQAAQAMAEQMANFLKAGIILQAKQWEMAATCRLCDLEDGPKYVLVGGGRGAAKQVKTSEKMLLWRRARNGKLIAMIKRADEILIGDFLIGSDGKEKRVLNKSIPERRQFYKVSFDDGSSLEVSDQHLWTVFDLSKRAPSHRERGWFMTTVETQWLASQKLKYRTQNRFAIPILSGPVEPSFPTQPLLPPYTLGYWLGNGFRQGTSLHCHKKDTKEIARYVSGEIGLSNITLKHYKSAAVKGDTILIRGWIQRLRSVKWPFQTKRTNSRRKRYDFADDQCYIEWRNWSSENRKLLLAGLLDSDGTTKDKGVLEFDSTDFGLCQLVRELLQSLGLKPYTIRARNPKTENRSICYRVTCSPDMQVFRLKRKQKRLKTIGRQLREKRRYIVSIEKAAVEEGICFEVDSPDHLYVAGKEYILTHNTHGILCQEWLDDCQRIAGLKVLVLRKISASNKQQVADFVKKLLSGVKHNYREYRQTIEFENGSLVVLGNFKDEKDIDKYLGLEYDLIHIVESNQLTPTKRINILSCLRTNKPNWRPRSYEDTNPGGINHSGNKAMFYEPFRKGIQTVTRYIHCTIEDNQFVDKGYKDFLISLVGWQREAWLHGSWDFMAGAFFSNFHTDIHVYPNQKITFTDKDFCRWFLAYDFGLSHNAAAILCGETRNGLTCAVDEFCQNELVISEQAEEIKAMLRRHQLEPVDLDFMVAGKDCFNRNEEGRTIAQLFEIEGLSFTQADVDRMNGWKRMHSLWGDMSNGVQPKGYVHSRCVNLIDQIGKAQHNMKRPGDIEKFNADEFGDGGDDALDAFRFVCASDPNQAIAWAKPLQVAGFQPAMIAIGV